MAPETQRRKKAYYAEWASRPEVQEHIREYVRGRWRDPEYRERQKQRHEARKHTPEFKQRVRENHTRRRYGMTVDDVTAMLAKQGGSCAICGCSIGPGTLHIDHSHQTGAVRGLLCFGCNVGLGSFKDNGALLRKAAVYLGGAQ